MEATIVMTMGFNSDTDGLSVVLRYYVIKSIPVTWACNR